MHMPETTKNGDESEMLRGLHKTCIKYNKPLFILPAQIVQDSSAPVWK